MFRPYKVILRPSKKTDPRALESVFLESLRIVVHRDWAGTGWPQVGHDVGQSTQTLFWITEAGLLEAAATIVCTVEF